MWTVDHDHKIPGVEVDSLVRVVLRVESAVVHPLSTFLRPY